MRQLHPLPRLRRLWRLSRRGQSLVEFALVLPILIVLLLGIADFGRVFHAGILVESAVRAAAEATAIEYERDPPDPLVPGDPAYYQRLHLVAARTACEELKGLPNTTYALSGSNSVCATWPAVATCVHDALDPLCDGTAPIGFTSGSPTDCPQMAGGWAPAADGQGNDYVEVRVCYRFTTLFDLQFSLPFNAGLSLGEVFLQRQAYFTVADY
jgi:hypothetical protein